MAETWADKSGPWLACLAIGTALAALPMPGRAADDQSLIARGKYLAQAGDCVACHSAPGGQPYAGGLLLNTPFGKMSTPNITPDKATGIGNWTDDQFYRALHLGIDDTGKNLYPGLPYPWFTKVTRDDVLAIKAYLFSLAPVDAPRKPSSLMFPFNVRAGIAGWNALYFQPGEFKPDPAHDAQWNRGAYLVEGLGHCGDCHTPKNAAQAPDKSQRFAGGKVDNWFAPNISSDVREGIGSWSDQELAHFLKSGAAPGRGVVFGPMAQTVHDSLGHLNDADLLAMATYLKATPAKVEYTPSRLAASSDSRPGVTVYFNHCAACHQPDGKGIAGAVPPLVGNGAVTAAGPQDAVRAVVGGLQAQGSYGPMPGFATVLSPQQIADVVNWVRGSWTNQAPANADSRMVSALVPDTQTMLAGTASHWCTKPEGGAAKVMQEAGAGSDATLRSINETNMLPKVNDLVAGLRRQAPKASSADLVNGLTAAYCPIVAADTALQPPAKLAELDRFSILLYTQLSTGTAD